MSSPRQIIKQLRKELRELRWPTGTADLVFGDTAEIVSSLDLPEVPERTPYALLSLGSQVPDRSDPDLLEQEGVLTLAVARAGDPYGTAAVLGGPQTQGVGRSEGKALLDVERVTLAHVGRLTGADGLPIMVSEASGTDVEAYSEDVQHARRRYLLSVVCSRADEYRPPRNFVATGGVGQVALSWLLPTQDYGLNEIVVRYAAGATAPASYSAGTPVTLSSALATSVTVSGLAAGTYSFAIFAGYSETGAASNEFYSSQVLGTTRLSVTVT